MVSSSPPSSQLLPQQRRGSAVNDPPTSPTTISTIAPATEKTNTCVRSKLLYKLGFENGAVPSLPSKREPSRGSLLGQVQTRTEPLKYDANFDKKLQEKKERALQRASETSSGNVFLALGSLFSSQPPEQQQQQQSIAETDAERDDTESFKPSSVTSTDASSVASLHDKKLNPIKQEIMNSFIRNLLVFS